MLKFQDLFGDWIKLDDYSVIFKLQEYGKLKYNNVKKEYKRLYRIFRILKKRMFIKWLKIEEIGKFEGISYFEARKILIGG